MPPTNLARPKSRFPILDSPGRGTAFWLHMSFSNSLGAVPTEAPRRKYVVLNTWNTDYVAAFKAANPSCMLLCYKDLSSVRSYAQTGGVDDADLPAGLGWNEANTLAAGGSDYFLKSQATGERIEWTSFNSAYAGHWQMDVSQAGYRTRWADNVLASVVPKGFDGILADNAIFRANQYGTVGTAYTTNAATQTAYQGFLQAIYPRFQAAGIKLFANTTNARINGTAWNDYHQYLDGGLDEFFLTFSSTAFLEEYPEGWSKQVAEIVDNEAAGKATIVQAHFTAGDATAFRYAYASYLCGAGGRSSFSEVGATDAYTDPKPYHTEYDWDLGSPTGAYFVVPGQTKVFRRNFSAGAVVVNANTKDSTAVVVTLGATYLDESGASVTSVSLQGGRGTILRTP